MNDKDKKPGNPWTKSLLIWVGVLFALVLFVQMIDGGSRAQAGNPINYSDFVREVNEGNVRAVTIATGSTNKEIAALLHLSPHTVKEHTSAIYRKLGVRNRAEATRQAQRLKILV